jgi:hypothetical protein
MAIISNEERENDMSIIVAERNSFIIPVLSTKALLAAQNGWCFPTKSLAMFPIIQILTELPTEKSLVRAQWIPEHVYEKVDKSFILKIRNDTSEQFDFQRSKWKKSNWFQNFVILPQGNFQFPQADGVDPHFQFIATYLSFTLVV